MVQYTNRPHGKKGEQGKEGGKKAQEKRPVLSFEQEIDERAKHLNERMGKLQTQMDAQKKLLNDREEELSDEEKEMFREQLGVLASRVLRVAEQINTGVIIPLKEHDEAQEELARAQRKGSIRGLGKFDEKRQVFITDDETKIKIDVRVPELGHQGKCGFSVVGEGEGMRAIFQYDGYALEMVYHTDTQKFEVYHTRKGADVTYEGVYDNPDKLPEVFEHFREKVGGDKEIERLRKEMRDEERRAVDSNGEEPDKIQKVRSGGIPHIEDTEARKRKELERQLTIERSAALKDKDAVPDDTPRSPREQLPHKPSPTSNIEDMPVNVDIGGDRRKRYVKRLPVIERGKGARRVTQEVNGNGFYDIGDVGEYNPTTGEAAIRDAHFDLNIAGVPRSSIETSADGGVRVVLASFYDNHYFIELQYNPSEKKCSVSTYFDTHLKQTQTVEDDDKFNRQLHQAVENAKALIQDDVVRLQRSQLELEDRVRRLPQEVQRSRRIQEGRSAYARAVRGFHEGKIDEIKLSMIRRELEDLLDELSVEGLGRKLEEDALKTLAHERSTLDDSRGSLEKLGQKTPEGEYLSGELEALYELLRRIEGGEHAFVHEYVVRKEDYLDQLTVLTTEKFRPVSRTDLERAVRPIDQYIESLDLDATERKKKDVAREKEKEKEKESQREHVRQIASERGRALKIEEYLKRGLWDDFDAVLLEEKSEIDELRRGTASASFDQRDRESLGRDVGRLSALRKKIQEAAEIADEEERKIEVEMLVHQYALLKAKIYDAMRILASSQSGRMSDYVSPARTKMARSPKETLVEKQGEARKGAQREEPQVVENGDSKAEKSRERSTPQIVERARRAIGDYRRWLEELTEENRVEVMPLIERLDEELKKPEPNKPFVESTLTRINNLFLKYRSRPVQENGLGQEVDQRAAVTEEAAVEEAKRKLKELFEPQVERSVVERIVELSDADIVDEEPALPPSFPFAPAVDAEEPPPPPAPRESATPTPPREFPAVRLAAEALPSPTPSPEAPETYDTGTHQVIFPPEYMGRPAEVPAELQEIHLRTRIGTVNGRSDYGGPRSKYADENQDSMFADAGEDRIIVGVVDGAGGSGGGLLASRVANEHLLQALLEGATMEDAFDEADVQVTKLPKGISPATRKPEPAYATAVVAQIAREGRVTLGWRGDAKAMTIRNGEKVRGGTTKLQNFAWEMNEGTDEEKNFYNHPFNYAITGSIGDSGSGKREPTGILEFQARNGDQIVLASDALWDIASEHEVVELAKMHRGRALEEALYQLVYDRYNSGKDFTIVHAPGEEVPMEPHRGDNITIQVVEITHLEEPAPTPVPPSVEELVRANTEPSLPIQQKEEESPFAQLKGIDPARKIIPESEERRQRAEEEIQRIRDEERRKEEEERQLEKDILEMLKAQNPDVFGNLEGVHIVFGAGFEESIKLIEQNGQVTAVFVTREFAQSLVSNI